MEKIKRTLAHEAAPVIIICAVIVLNLILSALTSALGIMVYAEEEADLSISDVGDTLFADAIAKDRKVTVTFCMYSDALDAHSTGKFVHTTAKNFAEKYPDLIELRYVNALTQLDSESKLFDFEKYKTDMRGEENKIYTTSVIFECEDNYRVVTDLVSSAGFADFFTLDSSLVATSYNGEEVFASMVAWVLSRDHGTAYFTSGHGETATLNLFNVLTCAGYYVDEINLKRREIPENADLIIISNPRLDFERAASTSNVRTEMERMKTYAERGGNFLVALDPYTKDLPVLESFLSEFGIAIFDTEEGKRQVIKDMSDAITTDGFTLVTSIADGELGAAVTQNIDGGRVIIKDAAPLSLSKGAKPLLISSPSAVCQSGGATTDTAGSYTIAATSTLQGEDGAEAKMFVISSVYLAATDAIITAGYSNKDFIYSLFGEFFGEGTVQMPYGCNSVVYDNQILENLTMGTARFYTAALVLIPVLIAAAGIVIIVRRKAR